jgi:spore coat protein U-like protein
MSSAKRRSALAVLGAAALACIAPAASNAATATAQFSVTATINASCTINASGLSFGPFVGSLTFGTGQVTVNCSNTTPYSVGLDAGLASGATVTTRKMQGPGGALLAYGLFQNPAHTTNWGNTPTVDTVDGIGNGQNQNLSVYGDIPLSQNVAPGSYQDTITATITY